jgi:hypothetical protein
LRRYSTSGLPYAIVRIGILGAPRGPTGQRAHVVLEARDTVNAMVSRASASYAMAQVVPGTYCSPRHRYAFFNPRFLSSMACYDVARSICQALGAGGQTADEPGGRGRGGRGADAAHVLRGRRRQEKGAWSPFPSSPTRGICHLGRPMTGTTLQYECFCMGEVPKSYRHTNVCSQHEGRERGVCPQHPPQPGMDITSHMPPS